MSFVKSMFSVKKGRGREEFADSGGRSLSMNGSPGGIRSSPGGGTAVAASKTRESSSPKHSPKKPLSAVQTSPQSNGKGKDPADLGNPTQEEIDAMNLPFKDRTANKRDKNLSISRSGRHKYKAKQRMSVLSHDLYSDIPADQDQGSSASGGSKGGKRGVESHSRQFQSHQRPALSISGASAAV